METAREPSPREEEDGVSWSILDGEFKPSSDWPNLQEVKIIKGLSAQYQNEDVQRRIYYGELLLYAMRYANPSLIEITVPEKQVVKALIDEISGVVYKLEAKQRKEDIQETAETKVDLPLDNPKDVPVMQALRAMQEAGAIDYETWTVLGAIVGAVHIKQSAERSSPRDVQ